MAALSIPDTAPVWVHQAEPSASVSLGAAIERAISRAAVPINWTKGSLEDRVSDVRALMVATAYLAQAFSMFPISSGTLGTRSAIKIEVPDDASAYTSAERADIARTLLRTWRLLDERATIVGASGASQPRLLTVGGGAPIPIPPTKVPVPMGEAGAFPVIEVVAIVSAGIFWVFVVERSAHILDRAIARAQDSAAMMATQAKVTDVLNQHREAEKAAGKELPLTAAESDVLKRLQAMQDDYSKRNAAKGPFPELFPSSGGVTAWGIVAILAIAAVMVLKK